MVSKASEDFPEPLKPVITVKVLRGISTSIFFRLCCRAPCTVMRLSIARGTLYFSSAVRGGWALVAGCWGVVVLPGRQFVFDDALGDSCVWESVFFKWLILYGVARGFRRGGRLIFH